MRTLNLSEVSRALRPKVALKRALLLKDVLDRIPLPPFDAIPGAATEGGEAAPTAPSDIVRWTFRTEEPQPRVDGTLPAKNDYFFTIGVSLRLG